jgi:hypothetical protein
MRVLWMARGPKNNVGKTLGQLKVLPPDAKDRSPGLRRLFSLASIKSGKGQGTPLQRH